MSDLLTISGVWWTARPFIAATPGAVALLTDAPYRYQPDVGDVADVRAQFSDGGAPADPTTITLMVVRPDGVEIAYVYNSDGEVARLSAGLYRPAFIYDQPGWWRLHWAGTQACQAASPPVWVWVR